MILSSVYLNNKNEWKKSQFRSPRPGVGGKKDWM